MKRNAAAGSTVCGVMVLFLVLGFGVSLAAEQPLPKLVDGGWLQANLGNENVRIIDVRADVREYWAGHIPGAVYFSPDAMRLSDHGVPVKVVPPEILALMLGKMGANEKTTIVVYAEGNDFKAPYLIWALDYIRHPASTMLNGGFDAWKKAGRPVTQDYPKITPVEYKRTAGVNEGVRASLEEVRAAVEDGGAALLDVRPLDLYTGAKGDWKRKGHIKGAISHPWSENLEPDGSWKSIEDLRMDYKGQGVSANRPIIVSCGQGQMAAQTYFTLKYILGYPEVKNYDGSFNEWSNIDSLPVETGAGQPNVKAGDGR
jgi:thiosulfate/3-mercaptopyruvate sulfurtransferase